MEVTLKEKEYKSYILEHIVNINTARIEYGDRLCEILHISPFKLVLPIMVHDKSKWSEEEFDSYRQYFYPCSDEEPNKEIFDIAWKHHYQNNPHHPEYWVDEDSGIIKDMPPIYIAEMLLDWEAMSIKFNNNTYDYYMKEKDNKPFSENTRKIIDEIITIFKK